MDRESIILGVLNLCTGFLIVCLGLLFLKRKAVANSCGVAYSSQASLPEKRQLKIHDFHAQRFIIGGCCLSFIGIGTFFLSVQDHYVLLALLSLGPLAIFPFLPIMDVLLPKHRI